MHRLGRVELLRFAAFVLLVAAGLLLATPARADGLESVKQEHALLWGGDQEGGGPYVYPREDDPSRVTGFEVELAERFARHLGVPARFTQGNWDKLPDLLRSGKIHVVLNGYEWTAERAATMQSSIPYYVYALQLLARKDDSSIRSWEDLQRRTPDGSKRRVGVLSASAAERYVEEKLGDAVETVVYDGNSDAMAETQNRKIDACLEDTPIASFYAPRFPGLHPVGAPVGEGYYVAYTKKGDRALVHSLNESIVLLWKSGELERLYRRYGIWSSSQERLGAIVESGRFFDLAPALDAPVERGTPPEATKVELSARKHGLAVARDYGGIMLQSAGMTVVLAVLAFPIAIAIGLMVAIGRLYGPGWLRTPLAAYVEFLRGTPLMLQLYFIFFFLPELGLRVPAFATSIIGLAINYSAYEAEIYRAGLQSIPVGQMEAALSLGMSRATALRRVVVPQAVRVVLPPVVNDFIALFKDTSVCSVVTIVELTKRYSVLSMSTQATVELMLMTAALYLLMSYPLALASRRLERRFGIAVPA